MLKLPCMVPLYINLFSMFWSIRMTSVQFLLQEKQARVKMIDYFCRAGSQALAKLNDKHTLEETARIFSIEQQQFKQGLPMYAQKAEFLAALANAQCIVLRGGTGIGKCTQHPASMYDSDTHHFPGCNQKQCITTHSSLYTSV